MLNMSRRDVVIGAGLATALGLNSRLAIVRPAWAQPTPEAGKGVYKYKVGSVGDRPLRWNLEEAARSGVHKNASVDDTGQRWPKPG